MARLKKIKYFFLKDAVLMKLFRALQMTYSLKMTKTNENMALFIEKS